jgi:hypothetical protein
MRKLVSVESYEQVLSRGRQSVALMWPTVDGMTHDTSSASPTDGLLGAVDSRVSRPRGSAPRLHLVAARPINNAERVKIHAHQSHWELLALIDRYATKAWRLKMAKSVRRIVTGHSKAGKSVILMDVRHRMPSARRRSRSSLIRSFGSLTNLRRQIEATRIRHRRAACWGSNRRAEAQFSA